MWKVTWRLFNRGQWLSGLSQERKAAIQTDLWLWERMVRLADWENTADVLIDSPRATTEQNRIWFHMPLSGLRVGTELDFMNQRVWVRWIES